MKKKRIGDLLERLKDPVEIEDDKTYKRLTIRINHKGVTLRDTELGANIGTKKQFRVCGGDFILSKIDARQGAFGIIPPEGDGAIITGNFWTYRVATDEVDTEWFLHFTNSPVFLDLCKRSSTGNTHRKYLDESIFLAHELEIPDLTEQEDQVAKYKSQKKTGSLVATEITHQQTLLGKLKQAILQEAIQGKLTADWRAANPVGDLSTEASAKVEPASELLQRIQAEKARLIAEKKIRKEKPLPEITPEEIPFKIPDGWAWCRFVDTSINRDVERKPISKAERERRKKIYPYYGASGVIDKIDGFTHDGTFLLIGEDGSNLRLRSTPIAFEASGKIWVNNHAHVIEFSEATLQQFVEHRLNGMDLSPFVTGGFQPKLSQGNLNRIPIPLPPLAEQAAIVERVEALMATCRELEAGIASSRTHAADLLQAVLKEAFASAS